MHLHFQFSLILGITPVAGSCNLLVANNTEALPRKAFAILHLVDFDTVSCLHRQNRVSALNALDAAEEK